MIAQFGFYPLASSCDSWPERGVAGLVFASLIYAKANHPG
jgi:hypothetical protein